MRRIRTIKPEFFTDEDLAELSIPTRLLFVALWTMADREGRLEDKPKSIKLASFPWDDVDVETALSDLAAAGFILRYLIDGKRYIQVLNFVKHQRPNHREAESSIPAPACPGLPVNAPGEGKGREGKGREREPSPRHGDDVDPAVAEGLLAAAERAGDRKKASHYRAVLDRVGVLR